MKNPCKSCIVRAACSEQCEKYTNYSRIASEVVTFIALVTSAATIGPLLIYLSVLADRGSDWANLGIVIMWAISFAIIIVLQHPLGEEDQTSFVSNLLFAPFVAFCMVSFYLARPFCKSAAIKERRIIF